MLQSHALHFETEMHIFLFQNGVLWDLGQVHCGIREVGLLVGQPKWASVAESGVDKGVLVLSNMERVVIMITLSTLVALKVVVVTISSATNDKFGILTTLGFQ